MMVECIVLLIVTMEMLRYLSDSDGPAPGHSATRRQGELPELARDYHEWRFGTASAGASDAHEAQQVSDTSELHLLEHRDFKL